MTWLRYVLQCFSYRNECSLLQEVVKASIALMESGYHASRAAQMAAKAQGAAESAH